MKKVGAIKIKPSMNADELILEYKKAGVLNAGAVAEGVDIYETMVKNDATVFLGLSGALVAGGMRKVIRDLINDGLVDVLVTTGANLVHDLIEASGGKHYIGSCRVDDVELKNKEINRIYDIFLPERHYAKFGEYVRGIYKEIADQHKELSIREFLFEIGKRVKDEESIIRTAYKKNVPIFCPGISDSEIGLTFRDYANKVTVNVFKDVNEFIDVVRKSNKSGAIILGGGVPKNFILQAMVPEDMKKERGGHEYVVQITLDRPETGGLSGATLEEAVSWGKIKENKKDRVTIIAEVSTVFPLMVVALKERLR
ncbi:MAG: deoxyhypusine synthase [Candidatus Hydrothermarchaeales archaeon]